MTFWARKPPLMKIVPTVSAASGCRRVARA